MGRGGILHDSPHRTGLFYVIQEAHAGRSPYQKSKFYTFERKRHLLGFTKTGRVDGCEPVNS